MRFRFVEENRGAVPTERLCRIMNVSSRGFRAFRSRPISQSQRKDMVLLAHIREQHRLSLGLGFDVGHRRVGNAVVETFFKTIKAELIWRHPWHTRRAAELAIFEYINGFYNPRRRHSALGWKSPLAFERIAA
jgi:transposase InsO family protein